MSRSTINESSPGYLYFLIGDEHLGAPEDTEIFFKVGMTKDPRRRISSYITHHLGANPPVYYKVWMVQNEKLEESLALQHFQERRVIKKGSEEHSEVIRATKAEIEAYTPRDAQKRAIAPHTMMPSGRIAASYIMEQRFEEHWEELGEIQATAIAVIVSSLRTKGDARKLRAPCGTGKTHMTCEAIRMVAVDDPTLKVCILCPTKLIANQWRANLARLGMNAPILTGSDLRTGDGTTREDQTGYRFRIVTYASCPAIRVDPSWTYVFDEAHHTCGSIGSDDGVTKRLVNEATTAGCNRLFLTFTPKVHARSDFNSMDNPTIYGSDIPFPSMQELVRRGLMPDYRLTLTYRDKRETLRAVSNEMRHAKKIIVCLQSIEEIGAMEAFLKQTEENVYSVHSSSEGAHQISKNIEDFRGHTTRSWLLTCLVLLEGADIPEADTIVLLAPWTSETRLIQLMLRPGRWFPNKSTFNIVAPDDNEQHIEGNLRIAGLEVTPSKICHLRSAAQPTGTPPAGTPLDAVRQAKHIWAVSYTSKSGHSLSEGPDAVEKDFGSAVDNFQISAVQRGIHTATPGDLVILRGLTYVVFAYVLATKCNTESSPTGKKVKRVTIDVKYLPVRDGPRNKPCLLKVEKFKEYIRTLHSGSKAWQVCNPLYTAASKAPGKFKYDDDRRAIIERIIDPNSDFFQPTP
jgi:hypothetical protein